MTEKCEFWINSGPFGKPCGQPSTYQRKTIVKTEHKGQPYEFSPPDEYYCEHHSKLAAKWGGEMTPITPNIA